MAGRLDILWVPQETNALVTLGSELRLFRIRKTLPNEPLKAGQQRLGHDHMAVAEVLAVHSDIQYAKCVSAYHGKISFPLLALGCANGRVILSSFKQTGVECPLVGLELAPRHARPCNCVAWNPNDGAAHLLAAGLDKHRSEAGLFIWDLATPVAKQVSDSTPRPFRELSPGEAIFSLSWFPKSTQKIAAGAQRSVRIYDLRQASKESAMASQTKAVNGVCIDAFNDQRLAAFHENVISIWDTRSFERPLASITEPKNILRIGWNPTRSGLLTCVTKETNNISLHDVQTSIVTDEPDLVVLTRNIKCSKESPSAFAWHPKDENRLLTVSTTGALSDSVVFERMPALLSSNFGIAWTTGKEVKYGRMDGWSSDLVPSVDVSALKDDISFKMHDRVLRGYGLNPDPKLDIPLRNAALVADDEKLSEMWLRLKELITMSVDSKALVPVSSRMDKSRGHPQRGASSSSSSTAATNPKEAAACALPQPPSPLYGVKAALLLTSAASDGVLEGGQMCTKSTIDMVSCKGVEMRTRWKVFRNKGRSRALRLCGWEPDRESISFDVFIQNLIVDGEFERAAAIAVFNLHLKLAVEILQIADLAYADCRQHKKESWMIDFTAMAPSLRHLTSSREVVQVKSMYDYGDTLKFCIMALSGFTQEKAALWRELCGAVCSKLSDPYLRAIFSFLTANDDDDRDVIIKDRNGMKLADRVALACVFVPDSRLHDFIDKFTRCSIEEGDLDGLLLTGVSDEGLTLLQQFVDRSGDVQTAALAVSLAAAAGTVSVANDPRFTRWCQAYRSLLDQWALWHQRSEFDVQRNLLEQSENHMKEQVQLICNFCSKAVTPSPSVSTKASRNVAGHSSTALNAVKPVITSCSNCRKPLPRCALCQVNIGTALPGCTPTFDVSAAVVSTQLDNSQLRSWFTWCQSCRHGGHADHVAEWFATHKECPVTQCDCFCGSLDALTRGMPAS